MSDEELVGRAQSGDGEAFDTLISLHQNRVFALAYRMLGNAEEAADVQQETFIQAWRSLRKFRGQAAFSTWLSKIAINQCLSRKRRRQTEPLEQYMLDDLREPSETGSVACLERAETAAMVRKVTAALPAHYRALIVLREIEERPMDEVAQILGCSVASARTRLTRARKLLRERLEPYLAEEDL
jgi:RNA polymerase sigma-70 factor, ECF subfamily